MPTSPSGGGEGLAVFVLAWEEDGLDEIPWLDGLAGHRMNLSAIDAEVGKLAIGKARQFSDSITIAAPVTVVTNDIHSPFSFFPSLTFLVASTAPKDTVLDSLSRNLRDVAAMNAEI